MPAQTAKSSFAQRAKATAKAHADKPVEYGSGGALPEGIEGGVAQLTECKFGVYKDGDNKGEPFYMAMGTVISPVTFGGQHIQGLITKIGPIPVCDTPNAKGRRKTFDDAVVFVLNEYKKLGVTSDEITAADGDIEALAAGLKESAPHFKFRTWKGKATVEYPNPRVTEEWRGVIANYVPDNSVADNAVHTTNGQATALEEPATSEEGETVAEETNADASDDLAALVADADTGNQTAQAKLVDLAVANGAGREEAEGKATWQEVADLCSGNSGTSDNVVDFTALAASADEGDADAQQALRDAWLAAGKECDDEFDAMPWSDVAEVLASVVPVEEWVPKVKDAPAYPLLDSKTKKKIKTDVEIISVDVAKKTVTLKNLTTNKPILGTDKKPLQVAWSDLIRE